MPTIPGYQIVEQIYSGTRTTVCRGVRETDQQPVILKILQTEYPTTVELAKFKHEYEIQKNLDLAGVVKACSLENYRNSLVLVIEDMGGKSLSQYLSENPLLISDFLDIAIQLADTLGKLHQQQIIHKDIKPQNIIINPDNLQVKIADFSLASRLNIEEASNRNIQQLEGTLAYMSPEQTGRMNRGIDYRTDFYSLGITFYQMLVGKLPFESNDPMELVHFNIAKKPEPLQQINSEIPAILEAIVLKLLAKTAESRYQSGFGLQADLETCRQQFETTEKIVWFSLGSQDLSSQLQIPQKLYGRETELSQLLKAFERVCAGQTEMMLVAGYSGIGKSALVGETQKPLVQYRGYFISGKFDQFQRDIPYAAIIQAFSDLMQQLLAETEAQIEIWKQKLLEALGVNAQVIIDVIPEVELIIGKQPPVPELGPMESQNRLNLVFQKFIAALSQKEHPLVIFLDDLQWADVASLKLMSVVMADLDIQYLLLINAYRDNEVDATHPLMLALGEIEKAGATVNKITLQPLGKKDVNCLVADTLKCEVNRSLPLAELLLGKTNGNPFFLTQMLASLYAENLLQLKSDGNAVPQWQWDIQQIEAVGITDNVVELMLGKIQRLSEATQNVLKLAACIGNRFDLEMLAAVNEKSVSATAKQLWEGLQAGLVLPQSDAYKIPLVLWEYEDSKSGLCPVGYKFLHDRVQQAAYALIPEAEKKPVRLKIGRLLVDTPPEELEEKIFDIVNHLNIGRELITSEIEKKQVASLNLTAGRKGKAAAAYQAALNYLRMGLEMLAADSWETDYDLTLALHIEATEAEYLNSNFEASRLLGDGTLQQTKTLLERVKVFELQIQCYLAQNQMQEALALGLEVVEMLGVSLDKEAPKIEMTFEELANLPEMTELYKLAALSLLTRVSTAAFVTNLTMSMQIYFTKINLCIKYGNSPLVAPAYVSYGMIMTGEMTEIEAGYQFGKQGVSLLDKLDARKFKAMVLDVFNSCVRHWKEPIRETLESLLEAFHSGLEIGDLVFGGYAILVYCTNLFFLGEQLEFVDRQQEQNLEKLQKLKLEYHLAYGQIGRQLTLNLLGQAEDKLQLIGEAFNETETLPFLKEHNIGTAIVYAYLAKAMLCYLFQEPELAITAAKEAEKYRGAATGFLTVAENNFYYSLALLASYPTVAKAQQSEYLSQVELNQEKMKIWADHAPFNFQNKYDLVEAEKARVLGEYLRAMELYDSAISLAREQGFIHEEAIAYESAAEFYQSLGRTEISELYIKNAHRCYTRWGAVAKVEDLESRYSFLITGANGNSASHQITANFDSKTTATSDGNSQILDLTTAIKASQTLASEMQIDRLLEKLMKIAIENAGGETGFLILQQEDNWVIQASATVDTEGVAVMQALPLDTKNPDTQNPLLSRAIVNYVIRTQENLVLNDASNQGQFTRDAYIVATQPQSILCTPLIHQNKLIGILYLENNLSAGAFTSERLEVLKLLSSQIAISLDNAQLYSELQLFNQNLEKLVSTRTAELAQTLENLKATQNQLVESEKMAALGGLVAGVAHEINTPLGIGVTASSLLAEKTTAFFEIYKGGKMKRSDLEKFLDIAMQSSSMILSNLNRAADLISSFKQVAVDRSSEVKRTFQVREYLDEILLSLRSYLKPSNHEIEIHCDENLVLDSYPGALSQIVTNLVMNSLIHGYSEGETGKLVFEFKKEGESAIFTYSEDGMGIASENLNKIFDPFFTTKRN